MSNLSTSKLKLIESPAIITFVSTSVGGSEQRCYNQAQITQNHHTKGKPKIILSS